MFGARCSTEVTPSCHRVDIPASKVDQDTTDRDLTVHASQQPGEDVGSRAPVNLHTAAVLPKTAA